MNKPDVEGARSEGVNEAQPFDKLLTQADLVRASEIPAQGCPRRYCWWWISALFEWQLLPSEGCTFLKGKKPQGYKYPNTQCCRSVPSSDFDQFEPREPFIEADKIDPSRWLRYRDEKNAGAG